MWWLSRLIPGVLSFAYNVTSPIWSRLPSLWLDTTFIGILRDPISYWGLTSQCIYLGDIKWSGNLRYSFENPGSWNLWKFSSMKTYDTLCSCLMTTLPMLGDHSPQVSTAHARGLFRCWNHGNEVALILFTLFPLNACDWKVDFLWISSFHSPSPNKPFFSVALYQACFMLTAVSEFCLVVGGRFFVLSCSALK